MERLYRVRTPEMVEFTFPVAGLASRFLAWLVDALLLGGVLLVVVVFFAIIGIATMPALGVAGMEGAMAIALVLSFLAQWGYAVLFETLWDGRTPGKRLFSLRVIGEAGIRITLAQAAIRNFFRVLDSLPLGYVVGGLAHLVSPRGQRIGDLIAGAVVVREERRDVPKWIGLSQVKYNSFLEDPAIAARIARSIRQEERELCLELLLRRDELALATRAELFEKLAKHFAARLELPEAATFLSDEKLVMNVAHAVVERERARALLGDDRRAKAAPAAAAPPSVGHA